MSAKSGSKQCVQLLLPRKLYNDLVYLLSGLSQGDHFVGGERDIAEKVMQFLKKQKLLEGTVAEEE